MMNNHQTSPPFDARAAADHIEAALAEHGSAERAEHERRYLKSELRHVGVSVPTIRRIARAGLRSIGEVEHDELVALADALWSAPVHERRMAAVEVLDLCSDRLSVADAPLLERFLRESRTWALLDGLAASVVGALVERDPTAWDPVLHRWARDEDFWLRRASLLAHLPGLRRGGGDFERFAAFADRMLEEREFFVRKAIGWVLRETGKRRPDVVTEWLVPRAARAAGLTVREAVKHLPEEHRDRVLAARAAR